MQQKTRSGCARRPHCLKVRRCHVAIAELFRHTYDPEAMYSPFGLSATEKTSLFCPSSVASVCSHEPPSHSQTLQSADADASGVVSGQKQTPWTSTTCPRRTSHPQVAVSMSSAPFVLSAPQQSLFIHFERFLVFPQRRAGSGTA